MSTTQSRDQEARLPDATAAPIDVHTTETTRAQVVRYVSAALRLSLGWVFVWAFVDKVFGFGYATARADSWLNGGSPTEGFLSFAAVGPFKGVYNDIAGAVWADWLFMASLLAIGAAVMLGVAMRVAAASGAALLILMWTAVLPPANNLFMDDHLIYALVLVLLAALGAGRTAGLGQAWERLPVVQRNGWLK